MSNARNNPWFWGGKTRQQFEQELQKEAVLLSARPAKDVRVKVNKPAQPVKFDKEAINARRMALIAKGILKPVAKSATVSVNVTR